MLQPFADSQHILKAFEQLLRQYDIVDAYDENIAGCVVDLKQNSQYVFRISYIQSTALRHSLLVHRLVGFTAPLDNGQVVYVKIRFKKVTELPTLA